MPGCRGERRTTLRSSRVRRCPRATGNGSRPYRRVKRASSGHQPAVSAWSAGDQGVTGAKARAQNGLLVARESAWEPMFECMTGPIIVSLAHMCEVEVAFATSVLSVHTGGSELVRHAPSVELDAP